MSNPAYSDVLTPSRLAGLRRVAADPRARLQPQQRDWLRERGYIVPAEPKPLPRDKRPPTDRRFVARAYAVTEFGRQELAARAAEGTAT